ncbi:ATP-binding cassette domain-containing protein [uncultured Clostridium sp.]|uniref:ATP-binding cassette domain-containing protein n=1 Tax=uncultured Clostridium sp. TaxID=59620 RepID=UPI0025CBF0D0|nr:ABC transporter ATP-binding protein [uncultured Clostridium sp.]
MIKLVNLNKAYRDKVVLKNLNLEINKGEIIGLLAPNAEGKSTLLKILGGQITFDSGQYFFNGEEFNYKDKEVIGYMNDTAIMPKKWKVIDGIDYYSEYFKTFNKEKCLDMLKYFKIDLKKRIKTLSKGESEKYHLSLALSIEGQLYIMDEPLAAIDLISREEVISMILDNFNIDSTIIISSHLVSDIERMLDRVMLLKNGEIVCNKLVEDLRSEGKSVVDLYKEVYANVK